MNSEQLQEIAVLAKLQIHTDEIDSMLADFNKIVAYVDKIKELDTSSIEEDEIYSHQGNTLRPDTVSLRIGKEDFAKIAPAFANDSVVVPKVIET